MARAGLVILARTSILASYMSLLRKVLAKNPRRTDCAFEWQHVPAFDWLLM